MKNFAIGLPRRYSLRLGLGTPPGLAVAYHFTEPELLNILKAIQLKVQLQGFSLIVMIFLMIEHLIIGLLATFQVC
jgi:hypothetical protein